MKDKDFLVNNGVNIDKSLELFGDMETYNETLSDYLDSIESKVNELNSYKEKGDMNNYAILVHSMKSDARYLGFVTLADIAYQLELKSKANDVMFVYDNHSKLLTELIRVVNFSQEYLGKVVVQNSFIKSNNNEGNCETLLIVDDSNLVANFVKKIFNDRFEVIIANDGEEALRIINSDKKPYIKCCLLDLNMPKVNGFQVLKYFKDNDLFVSIPVSIITGNDTRELVDEAFKYPIVDLLSKPFNERDVKRIIEKTLSNYY